MESSVLHGMVIGLTVFISLAVGLVLSRLTPLWLNDDAQLETLRHSRLHRGPWLLGAGLLLAAAAALTFPFAEVIPAGIAQGADHIGVALSLGGAAGATPYLVSADALVRRLPDRIVYPLIVLCLSVFVLASVFGDSQVWFLALFSGIAATLLFALLHLTGRVGHVRTMGLGDVKLAFIVFSLPALFDPWAPLLVLILTMLVSGVWALFAVVRARRLRGVTIAFGPAMLSGMWLGSILAPFLL